MQTRSKGKSCLLAILAIWESNKDCSALTQHHYVMFVCRENKFAANLITKAVIRMATSDMNLVTLCAVAGCSVNRVASSKFGFSQIPNTIDSDKRSEKLS